MLSAFRNYGLIQTSLIHFGNEPNFAMKQSFLYLSVYTYLYLLTLLIKEETSSALEQEYYSPVSNDLLLIWGLKDTLYYLISLK